MLKFEAGYKDILKLTAFLGVLYLLSQVLSILALLFIAIILTSSINPLIDYLEAHKIPRQASIVCLVIATGLGLYIGITSVLPDIVSQMTIFLRELPRALADIIRITSLEDYTDLDARDLDAFSNQLEDQVVEFVRTSSADIVELGFGILDGILSFVTLAVITFYLLVDHGTIKDFFLTFAPEDSRFKVAAIWDVVERKLGVWLRGQLVVMAIIGVVTYIGLTLLGVPLALPLAIIAGLLEIVPIIGPIISAVPALIIAVATAQNPVLEFFTIGTFYFIVQQLEAIFVVPKVMNQAVGLNPIVIILAVTVGSRLGGPVGALLSVPVAVLLYIALEEWRKTTPSYPPQVIQAVPLEVLDENTPKVQEF